MTVNTCVWKKKKKNREEISTDGDGVLRDSNEIASNKAAKLIREFHSCSPRVNNYIYRRKCICRYFIYGQA